MSVFLTPEDWRRMGADVLTDAERALIDRMFDTLNREMEEAGLTPAHDHRAEALQDALTYYLLASRPKEGP